MGELKEVTARRAFETLSNEMWEKRKEEERRSLLRPSALTEIIQLMHARSLWPSVMRELTLKFAYKNEDCYKKVLEEENWTAECDREAKALEQEGWVTEDDIDDDDGAAAPAPIQRPPLQMRRRRGRRGNPLCVRFAPC